jgi:hypothetical protein
VGGGGEGEEDEDGRGMMYRRDGFMRWVLGEAGGGGVTANS